MLLRHCIILQWYVSVGETRLRRVRACPCFRTEHRMAMQVFYRNIVFKVAGLLEGSHFLGNS
jgi:hypothetical protein